MRRLTMVLVILLLSLPLFAQRGQLVDLYQGQSQIPVTTRLYRDASNNSEFICVATRDQPEYSWTLASAAITNIVDSGTTSTVTFAAAHGLAIGNKIVVSGVTTDTDLNGTYVIASVPLSTTVTVTTSGVTDDTYVDATIKIVSAAPRGTAPIWDVTRYFYTTTYLDRIQSSSPRSICDNRATLAYH